MGIILLDWKVPVLLANVKSLNTLNYSVYLVFIMLTKESKKNCYLHEPSLPLLLQCLFPTVYFQTTQNRRIAIKYIVFTNIWNLLITKSKAPTVMIKKYHSTLQNKVYIWSSFTSLKLTSGIFFINLFVLMFAERQKNTN